MGGSTVIARHSTGQQILLVHSPILCQRMASLAVLINAILVSQPNTTLTEQETGWINECAGRLRLIQADAATAVPEKRREYLQEEVARSLKSQPSANRKRYLEALLARFPVAGQIVKSVPAAPAPAPAPVAESDAEMLERFLAAAAKLPEEKRTELGKQLSETGLVWVDRDTPVLEISDELRQGLGLPAGQQPRLKRLVELSVLLVDMLQRLDQRALDTMRELSPKSPLLKRPQDFRNAAGRFLISENEPLEPHLQTMRSLLGALLAAMQGGGKDFGRQYMEQFSPTAIEDVVMGEGKGSIIPGFGKSRKEHCWDKYKDLVGDYTADLMDRRIKDCLAAFVERTIRGGR